MLALSLAIGVVCSVCGVVTTGRSIAMSPELSVGGVSFGVVDGRVTGLFSPIL